MTATTEPANVFKQSTALRKQGRIDDALLLLRDALRREQLMAEEVSRAGRFIAKALNDEAHASTSQKVLLLGQCTTTWLMQSLTAVAWGQGMSLRASEGSYDNVMQELLAIEPGDTAPDSIILLPWNNRLFHDDDRTSAQRVDDELAFWQQAWAQVTQRLGARLIQIGYDWITSGAMGHHIGSSIGHQAVVQQTNQALRDTLPQGAYFIDLPLVSGSMGREQFYEPRRYYWTKQPFSESGTVRLAKHIAAGLRALTTGPKKVLVVDLDNTLWGGVVGETGPHAIELGESPDGEAFAAFQMHLKALTQRGVLLAVSSKNNDADAREPFEKNSHMALSLADLAAFEANWQPKAAALERIAEQLNLGLDSFVFFDDNSAEREHIRQALPQVSVVEVPPDPAEYTRALENGLWFEAAALTDADTARAKQYQTENHRRELRSQVVSLDDYLQSLEMTGDVRAIDDADMQRVVQLIGKTNQFNLTTKRHSREKIEQLLAQPRSIGLTLRLVDRFGDHGLVSVLIGVPTEDDPSCITIDTWLMSCRVIGRGAEQFFFNALTDRALDLGFQSIHGQYARTAINTLVADLYTSLGFTQTDENRHPETSSFHLDLSQWAAPLVFIDNNK